MLTDFQNSFTASIKRQFVMKLSLQIPTHFKCVTTLPREMSDDTLKPATPLTGCVINVDRAWHAIGQWRRRLRRVVQQQGGHIENSM